MAEASSSHEQEQPTAASGPELSAEERLRQRREARRSKILAGGQTRLNRIVQTYASPQPAAPAAAPESSAEETPPESAANTPAESAQNAAAPSVRLEPAEHFRESRTLPQSVSETAPLLPRMQPNDMNDENARLEQMLMQAVAGNPFSANVSTSARAPQPPRRYSLTALLTDPLGIWAWLHTLCVVSLALFALFTFAMSQDPALHLESDKIDNDLDAAISIGSMTALTGRRLCNGIAMLSASPAVIAETISSATGIYISGVGILSIWICFLTIQVALIASQLIAPQLMTMFFRARANRSHSSASPPSAVIPDELSAVLTQHGLGHIVNLVQSISNSVSDTLRIVRYFTDDVMLFVFVIGVAVVVASVAKRFHGVC